MNSDQKNIAALAEHEGISLDEAERRYRKAREVGYGAAASEVTETPRTPRDDRPCQIERIVGGYWCRTHGRWADDGHVRRTAAIEATDD